MGGSLVENLWASLLQLYAFFSIKKKFWKLKKYIFIYWLINSWLGRQQNT
jgi:hypothetical protein